MLLDLKDRRILHSLQTNCRQSFTAIGREVGLSKETVQYRVRQLEKEGIIKGYQAIIDPFKIGYQAYRLYLKLQHSARKDIDDMISFFKSKNPWLIAELESKWDLSIILWVKSQKEFFQTYELFMQQFKPMIFSREMAVFQRLLDYRYSYLLDIKNDPIIIGNQDLIVCGTKNRILLSELAKNGRISILELSKKLNLHINTVKSHMKELENSGVIKRYSIILDYSKLGLHYFKADIKLSDYSVKGSILAHAKSQLYIRYVTETVGDSDIELEFHTPNYFEFEKIMRELQERFPKEIINFESYRFVKEHILNFFPEEN